MYVGLRNSHVEYVMYMGFTERYPFWFERELDNTVFYDDSRYTFWVPMHERRPDYYEKQLVEDDSVFIRKPNGEVHVTDYDTFRTLYQEFEYDETTNSGMASLRADCIEYVECHPGELRDDYPEWFYEYFTEALNFPKDDQTIYFFDEEDYIVKASRGGIEVAAGGEAIVTAHSVFLRNKRGEVRGMLYSDFIKYYDPNHGRRGKLL